VRGADDAALLHLPAPRFLTLRGDERSARSSYLAKVASMLALRSSSLTDSSALVTDGTTPSMRTGEGRASTSDAEAMRASGARAAKERIVGVVEKSR
jgi:hypothetical protein